MHCYHSRSNNVEDDCDILFSLFLLFCAQKRISVPQMSVYLKRWLQSHDQTAYVLRISPFLLRLSTLSWLISEKVIWLHKTLAAFPLSDRTLLRKVSNGSRCVSTWAWCVITNCSQNCAGRLVKWLNSILNSEERPLSASQWQKKP